MIFHGEAINEATQAVINTLAKHGINAEIFGDTYQDQIAEKIAELLKCYGKCCDENYVESNEPETSEFWLKQSVLTSMAIDA